MGLFGKAPPEERMRPDPTTHWWGEHRSRYQLAARYVAGRVALDIACGPGYGSRILLDAGAARVIAADIALEAVKEAQTDLAGDRRGIACVMDGSRLPLRASSIEVVASFETLEHVTDGAAFVDELRRVIVPDGVVVVSTPNALITKPVDGKPENPFHVHEYDPDEVRELMAESFSSVAVLGQRMSAEYRFSKFVDWRVGPGGPLRRRVGFMTWRLAHHLPFAIKNRWSRRVHGRDFYPGEHDWLFTEDDIDKAHVLVAVCRP